MITAERLFEDLQAAQKIAESVDQALADLPQSTFTHSLAKVASFKIHDAIRQITRLQCALEQVESNMIPGRSAVHQPPGALMKSA